MTERSSPKYSESDLLNIAIGIETRGMMFYDVMAKSSDNEDARAAFRFLVEMEREHLRNFQEMMAGLAPGQVSPDTSSPDAGYIQSLLETAVFTDDLITSEMASQADSDLKALELAISAEKDSILFYYELLDAVAPPTSARIRKILIEEKSHLAQLNDIKKRLGQSRGTA